MRSSGYTLIEVIVVTAVLGAVLAVALPHAVRWRDAAAVRAARDELAAALAFTRMAAASHGGAALVLDPMAGAVLTRTDNGRTLDAVDLGARYGVRLDPGVDEPVVFRYDALGIGRFTNRTVRIRRGAAEAGVITGAYGRYRRW